MLVTGDPSLLDDMLKLCAAAGVEPEVAYEAPPSPRSWRTAPLVLVGDDAAHRAVNVRRRDGVLLIGRDAHDPQVWRRAVTVGADQVLFLPDAEAWITAALADATEVAGPEALTVGVLGGRGGAGASTLACALALQAARLGHPALLIDADPLGGGLDLLLGAEETTGLRWRDLRETRGRLHGDTLANALPQPHALPVLSFDRSETLPVPAEAMRAVVCAARRRGGLLVLDLPRRADQETTQALARTDIALLVVPIELRALASARGVVAGVTPTLGDLRVVARGPAPAKLDGAQLARSLGLPLAGELPAEPGLPAAQERGEPPGLRSRSPVRRFCARFLTQVLEPVLEADARSSAGNGAA